MPTSFWISLGAMLIIVALALYFIPVSETYSAPGEPEAKEEKPKLRVLTAPTAVLISVTADDIAKADAVRGPYLPSRCCPVAQAMNRVVESPRGVSIGLVEGRVNESRPATAFRLPGRVNEFIDAYDSGKKPAPFNFPVVLPAGVTVRV